jgi:hypothetical protein
MPVNAVILESPFATPTSSETESSTTSNDDIAAVVVCRCADCLPQKDRSMGGECWIECVRRDRGARKKKRRRSNRRRDEDVQWRVVWQRDESSSEDDDDDDNDEVCCATCCGVSSDDESDGCGSGCEVSRRGPSAYRGLFLEGGGFYGGKGGSADDANRSSWSAISPAGRVR